MTREERSPLAEISFFNDFLRKGRVEQELFSRRIKEIAFDFIVEQVRRGFWSNPPVEAKLYLCGEGCCATLTEDEADAFIAVVAQSASQ
ncbi:MAG: hypothetical protein U9P50_02120 [Patescibacteria group bacterium]|nr:hypothetical protein [Patescibacteria group bacterium]